jgi:hypothetical protein
MSESRLLWWSELVPTRGICRTKMAIQASLITRIWFDQRVDKRMLGLMKVRICKGDEDGSVHSPTWCR